MIKGTRRGAVMRGMTKTNSVQGGFTLIELMVTVIVLVVLVQSVQSLGDRMVRSLAHRR